ncbi:MAG: hypothetical protein M3Z36_00315 [Acidobacteriota bacterium]|nr:hypothetical protein [Acidobacteriota bacterium]
MRVVLPLILLIAVSSLAAVDKLPKPKDPAPTAFATASAQAASIGKQREAIAKQQAVLGIPPPENAFFVLPSALNPPADSPFFILSER